MYLIPSPNTEHGLFYLPGRSDVFHNEVLGLIEEEYGLYGRDAIQLKTQIQHVIYQRHLINIIQQSETEFQMTGAILEAFMKGKAKTNTPTNKQPNKQTNIQTKQK